jgi:hypothetical protein
VQRVGGKHVECSPIIRRLGSDRRRNVLFVIADVTCYMRSQRGLLIMIGLI